MTIERRNRELQQNHSVNKQGVETRPAAESLFSMETVAHRKWSEWDGLAPE